MALWWSKLGDDYKKLLEVFKKKAIILGDVHWNLVTFFTIFFFNKVDVKIKTQNTAIIHIDCVE